MRQVWLIRFLLALPQGGPVLDFIIQSARVGLSAKILLNA
jgi:hypothetical protein